MELDKHIKECVSSLNTLDGIDFTDKEKASIEGLSRDLARQKLEVILEPFFTTEESTVNAKEALAQKTGVLL